MSAEDLDNYEADVELSLYREYRDVASQFSYVVETERRFYLANGVKLIPHTDGGDVHARSALVSTGVDYRRLGVESLEELVGRGVYYGAAMAAARELAGDHVVIVGGGNSAGQAAIHAARFATEVTIVVRRPDLAATMSSYLIDEIEWNPRITVRGSTRVVDGGPDDVNHLAWLHLEDVTTGE